VLEILQGLTQRGQIAGIDLVEVAPAYDPTDSTQILAGAIAPKFYRLYFSRRAMSGV
jgi:agmatinase